MNSIIKFPQEISGLSGKRILAIDDHALFCDIIIYNLSTYGASVNSANTSEEACRKINALPDFDLILLDYYMPNASNFDNFYKIKNAAPDAPIAFLTSSESLNMPSKANLLGASGFISKSIRPSGFIDAVGIMLAGGRFFEDTSHHANNNVKQFRCLTPREFDVLALLCEGHSNKKLGEFLGIAEATVKVHLKSIFLKIEARSRSHACMIAKDLELV
jgi:two-component system nitrate/nitrite response regulator NarL